MPYSIKLRGEVLLRLSIPGKCDVTAAPDPERMLVGLVDRQPWQLAFQLRMIDRIGIGALIRFGKRSHANGWPFTRLRDQPLART
jgi:hypothetical protein